MSGSEVVRRYANTLLDAAAEAGPGTEAVRSDMEGLTATLDSSGELRDFLRNRLLDVKLIETALEQLFADKMDPLVLNFLRLLARRGRASLLAEVAISCVEILDERSGVRTAEVRSAMELSPEQIEGLRRRLAAYSGGEIRLHTQVDPSLRGGMVARLGDTVFDGTLDMYLTKLHRSLRGG